MNLDDHHEQNSFKLAKNAFDVVPVTQFLFVWGVLESWQIYDGITLPFNLYRVDVRKLCDRSHRVANDIFVATVLFFLRLNFQFIIINNDLHFDSTQNCRDSRFADTCIADKHDTFLVFYLAFLMPKQKLPWQLFDWFFNPDRLLFGIITHSLGLCKNIALKSIKLYLNPNIYKTQSI